MVKPALNKNSVSLIPCNLLFYHGPYILNYRPAIIKLLGVRTLSGLNQTLIYIIDDSVRGWLRWLIIGFSCHNLSTETSIELIYTRKSFSIVRYIPSCNKIWSHQLIVMVPNSCSPYSRKGKGTGSACIKYPTP